MKEQFDVFTLKNNKYFDIKLMGYCRYGVKNQPVLVSLYVYGGVILLII